ncbi:MAG: tetratricopeptide repeat protein [Treponema sp.]|nr:tetratricopeptide repeat protein [Treponema sp.]MCL2231046.1 tetratricopeptide repeat protein [Treponema sp.]MCL2237804.1 tetratricopeptide repeat protein [Treponema sp.]
MKKITMAGTLLFLTVFCYGQANFTRGEELFMLNDPAQALPFLERALGEHPSNVITYIYLGIVYEQLNRPDEAIAVYRRVLPMAGNQSAAVANNLGNVYFSRGNNDLAEQFYTQAISINSVYPNAYLGRANTRIRAGHLLNAVTDYEQYLVLEPRAAQRENIERLIGLIRSDIAAEAMRREIAAEEARRIEEERARLLESVSASLQSLSDASKGLSAGAENIEHYEGEFELE